MIETFPQWSLLGKVKTVKQSWHLVISTSKVQNKRQKEEATIFIIECKNSLIITNSKRPRCVPSLELSVDSLHDCFPNRYFCKEGALSKLYEFQLAQLVKPPPSNTNTCKNYWVQRITNYGRSCCKSTPSLTYKRRAEDMTAPIHCREQLQIMIIEEMIVTTNLKV